MVDYFEKAFKLADALADYALAGVVDKQGRPLIEHCRRVAENCRSKGMSEEQQIVAVLHDVEEDGNINGLIGLSIQSLFEWVFPHPIADLVHSLTRGKDEPYKDYIRSLSEEAAEIKLEDLADNLDVQRGPIPESLRLRYEEAVRVLNSSPRRQEDGPSI